jgi:hypothetical protein
MKKESDLEGENLGRREFNFAANLLILLENLVSIFV